MRLASDSAGFQELVSDAEDLVREVQKLTPENRVLVHRIIRRAASLEAAAGEQAALAYIEQVATRLPLGEP